ncbi:MULTISPECIES: GntR family transcriptional regulator [Nocardiopsis]|uniref:GntR family transcriptional regulator n=1 Tax=Nocardiopsis TaxID=2013 RepID=UPI0003700E8C|nr:MULTISPECIES: GntR family transcriptional regulator [Nocardiopsis]PWV57623.1 GntR family transcriptional regulator [Nocardiopsis sp. L17-MgMaSL7]
MTRSARYQVIYDDLFAQITSGALESGAKLESEPELARRYQVSRMTVRQALDLLLADELVTRKRGSGTFVRENPRRGRRLNRLRSFAEELAGADEAVSSQILAATEEKAPEEVAEGLGLEVDGAVNRIRRLRLVDGVAAAVQDAWVPYAVAPGLAREPLVDGSLYRTLTERYGLKLRWANQTMTAALLDKAEAELLSAKEGGAVLHSLRVTYSDAERAIEFTNSWTLPEFPLLLRIDAE